MRVTSLVTAVNDKRHCVTVDEIVVAQRADLQQPPMQNSLVVMSTRKCNACLHSKRVIVVVAVVKNDAVIRARRAR